MYGVIQGKHRPLVEASAQGHVGLLMTLLKCKADVNETSQVYIRYAYTATMT